MGFARGWNLGTGDGFETMANAYYEATEPQLRHLRDLLKDWEKQSVRDNYLDLLTQAFPHLAFPKDDVQKYWFAEPAVQTHWTEKATTNTSEMEAICTSAADRIAELMLEDEAAQRPRRKCQMMGQCEWNEFAIWVTEFDGDKTDGAVDQINVWIFGPDNVDKEADLPLVADDGWLFGRVVRAPRIGREPALNDKPPSENPPFAGDPPSGPVRKITAIRWERTADKLGQSKAASLAPAAAPAQVAPLSGAVAPSSLRRSALWLRLWQWLRRAVGRLGRRALT
jgi:hypothetical protein